MIGMNEIKITLHVEIQRWYSKHIISFPLQQGMSVAEGSSIVTSENPYGAYCDWVLRRPFKHDDELEYNCGHLKDLGTWLRDANKYRGSIRWFLRKEI